jgi:hypothetical protein
MTNTVFNYGDLVQHIGTKAIGTVVSEQNEGGAVLVEWHEGEQEGTGFFSGQPNKYFVAKIMLEVLEKPADNKKAIIDELFNSFFNIALKKESEEHECKCGDNCDCGDDCDCGDNCSCHDDDDYHINMDSEERIEIRTQRVFNSDYYAVQLIDTQYEFASPGMYIETQCGLGISFVDWDEAVFFNHLKNILEIPYRCDYEEPKPIIVMEEDLELIKQGINELNAGLANLNRFNSESAYIIETTQYQTLEQREVGTRNIDGEYENKFLSALVNGFAFPTREEALKTCAKIKALLGRA